MQEKQYYFAEREDSPNYQGPFNSIEEARKEAENELDIGEEYWIGEEAKYLIQPGGYSILETISEDLDCETYEDAGERWCQSIKNASELGDELDNLIREFLAKKGIPTSITFIQAQKRYEVKQTEGEE